MVLMRESKHKVFETLTIKSWRGLLSMAVACVLFSMMALAVFASSVTQPPVSASVVSFIRVAVNLLVILLPAMVMGKTRMLFGDLGLSLWLRGLFGGISLMLSFGSIQRIGPGESGFLTASSGVFVALLGPWLLGQKSKTIDWLSILGSITGLFFLLQPRPDQADFIGRSMGLLSGFLAALAYLMIARASRTNSTKSIVFYFSLVAVMIHIAWFSILPESMPKTFESWVWALTAGVLGTVAQHFLTRAYQMAPAIMVSSVSYITPVISLFLGFILFDKRPDPEALYGGALILVSGLLLPFISARFRFIG